MVESKKLNHVTMQCTRCGYFNAETAEACIKCNTPLKKEKPLKSSGRKTQALPTQDENGDYTNKTIAEKSNGGKGEDFSASKTVIEKSGIGGNQDFSASKTVADYGNSATDADLNVGETISERGGQKQIPEVDIIPCPSCSYPVSGAAKYCPNCSHDLSQTVNTDAKKPKKQKSANMKERKSQKTVNIFAIDDTVKEETIVLTEIKQSGSKEIELTSEGMKISLNKETLQQEDNPAISSNSHADLINFEGEWYVINRSSAGTTFVAVNKPHKLSKDDVILVGDSMYRFNG